MYKNLLAEMARNDIDKKILARKLQISMKTIENKLNGATDFSVPEAKKIIQLFPNCTFEYIFWVPNSNINNNSDAVHIKQ